MSYGTIPSVKLPVSRVVFGASGQIMNFRSPSPNINEDYERAFTLLDEVFDAGINTFDAAAMYGEAVLGRWVESRNIRNQVVLLTKGCSNNQYRRRLTTYDLMSDLMDSFSKLRNDYIDIYLLHRDDPTVPVGPIIELLDKFCREGRIGVIGVSNWHHSRIDEANQYARDHGLTEFTVNSPSYGLAACMGDPFDGSITFSGPENQPAREWAAANQMPIFAYSSLARGFFSGRIKYTDVRKTAEDGHCFAEYGFPINYEKLRRAELLAKEKDVTMTQIAFAWLMHQPLNIFAVTSPSSTVHLNETLAALNLQLTDAECRWLNVECDER